jgi:phage recombination protein Bet
MTTRPNSALAVATNQEFWNAQQLAALSQIGVQDAPNADLAVFLNFAQKTGLDPFARQIYMIGRNSKDGKRWTIQASIDGLRIVAERSGDYAGQVGPEYCGEDGQWRDTWTSKEAPVAARVGVLRHGFKEPLYAVAYYDEYVQKFNNKPSQMWEEKPRLMLAKCAEALALRKAFPNDLSGLYTAEEVAKRDEAHTEHIVEAEVVEDEPTASKAQISFIIRLLTKAGHETIEAQRKFVSDTIGHPYEGDDLSALTKHDAYNLIETLKPLVDQADAADA